MTILFADDWKDHPNAIIDTQTTNTSFLRIAALFKSMGIRNHAFPLQLHNPELLGVNPYSSHLTSEQKFAIALECKDNIFYFLRECVKAPGGSDEYPLPFTANRGNMALMWLFMNHVTLILIQPRQTGKSISTDMLMTWLLNIACTNTTLNLLTKDDTLRASNLERLKSIELELPPYLKQRAKGEVGNTEELHIRSLKNKYIAHLPNKSPKLAMNVGRGLTSPIFHLDEAAFFFNIAISLPAALAAGTTSRYLAKAKNEPYGTIMTTTAGKKDDRDGKFIYSLLTNSATWTEKFYDTVDQEALELLIRNNSPKRELRVDCTFNHRQLGYTDQWLREVVEAAIAAGEDAERDFLVRWSDGSSESPLSKELAAVIKDSETRDFFSEIAEPYAYITRWFIPELSIKSKMNSGNYILSLDTSDAVGADDIALTLRDVRTAEVIAAGNYNETNLITFAIWICSLLVKYPNWTLIIERRSTGAMILDYLLLMLPNANINPFTRIYNKVFQDKDEFPDRYKEVMEIKYIKGNDIYTRYKKTFGFATSGTGATSRTELFSNTLLSAAKTSGNTVRDPKTVDQILSLVIKNGRVDHQVTGHDDLVVSWLLSYWLLQHGKNLNNYGINARDVLADNKIIKEQQSLVSPYDRYNNEKTRSDIEALIVEIEKENDQYILMRLELKLKLLYSRLSDADKELFSIDELLDTLRENKLQKNKSLFRRY
jgi:hypothetical protein